MAKIIDPILPILSILGYWAMILGSFGGPGNRTIRTQVARVLLFSYVVLGAPWFRVPLKRWIPK